MLRRLGPLVATFMLVASFAAGCGGDDEGSDSSGSSTPAAATTTEAPATTTEDSSAGESATDESDTSTDLSDNPQVKAAVEQCKQSIDANPSVDDDVKGDLRDICDKAVSGDPDDVKAAISEVCEKIVESSLPEGDAADQAKQACAAATG